MDAPTDRALVLRVRSGDDDAFGDLVGRHQSSVFNVCYRMLGDRAEAEDLAQEAFLRAYRKLDHYDEARPFGPWIRRLATNVCLNHVARHRPDQQALDERVALATPAPHGQPEQASMQAARALEVRRAILELPPHFRAVVELRHFQDLRYNEIAEALDLPLSDVKSNLFRARRALARKLKDMTDDV